MLPGELTIAEQIERSRRARAAARALRGPARVSRAMASGPRSLTPLPWSWWTRPRSMRCSPSTVTRTCVWWTTAWSIAARPRSLTCRMCVATISCPRPHRRRRPSRFIGESAAMRARRRSPSATRARTWPARRTSALSGWSPMPSSEIPRSGGDCARSTMCASPAAGHGAGVYEAVVETLVNR